MNTRTIEPVQIWSPDGQRIANEISLDNFHDYKFDNGIGYVDYTLKNTNGETYYTGTVEVPANIIQQWGASDDVIWEFVSTTLGLILIK
jgi:hypothetical protein